MALEPPETLLVQNPYLRGIPQRPLYLGLEIALPEGAANGMLQAFFERADSDPGVGPLHLALFMVLVHMARQSGRLPVRLYSHQGMAKARINSRASYCRVLNELHKGGFLYYQRSMYHKVPSRVWIHHVKSKLINELKEL